MPDCRGFVYSGPDALLEFHVDPGATAKEDDLISGSRSVARWRTHIGIKCRQ